MSRHLLIEQLDADGTGTPFGHVDLRYDFHLQTDLDGPWRLTCTGDASEVSKCKAALKLKKDLSDA